MSTRGFTLRAFIRMRARGRAYDRLERLMLEREAKRAGNPGCVNRDAPHRIINICFNYGPSSTPLLMPHLQQGTTP